MIKSFRNDTSGNIAVIFALALLPMLSLIGVAIDYSRASRGRAAMQAALDSTALMISRDASSLSQTQLTTTAQTYFTALLNRPDLNGMNVTATYTSSSAQGSKVALTASGSMTTDFLKVAGYPSLNLGTASTAAWGNTRLRVAMSLDTTGSMGSDGKISALQTAAKRMVDQLSASAKTNGDVYISIIPFAAEVNFGSSNYLQTWLDWTDWDYYNGTCIGKTSKTNKGSCNNYGVWTPKTHNNWNGCITDRDEDYDVKSTVPSILNTSTEFQPDQYAYCPAQMMPLSYDWTALKSRIDDLSAAGATNQPIGLVWGWMSLKQQAPLNAPAKDPAYQYKDIIILLSDGLNTQNKVAGDGSSHSTYVDNRQKILCDNVKADGMTIWAIQVNTDGDPLSTTLQYCASGADHFVMLTDADQIITTFDSIGSALTKLKIAQ